MISCIMQIERIFFISYKTFFKKGQERYNKYRMNSHVFIIHFKIDNLGFLIEKKFFVYLV